MADGYGIDQIEALIEQRIQQGYGFDPSKLNDAAQEILRTIEKIYDRTAQDPNGLSAKEINSAMKEIRDFLKSSGATTKETATYMSNWTNELKGLIKSGVTIDKARFQHSANANISNMMGLHILDPSKKSAQNNLLAQTLQKGYGKIEKKMDSIIEKLLYLCNMADKEEARENEKEGQEGKKKRQFIDDLVEGLARSKFVGGAFTDLIRLATFFAASWLKNRGWLGKALAVGLVALGPIIGTAIANILTKALVGGITNVLKTGLLALGTLLKATFMSFFKREAFASALGAKGSTVLGMSRGNIALGTGLAAIGLGVAAHNEWKEGRKGSAVAFGVGSAGFGVSAIASMLAPLFPLLAPLAPIAIAVAAIATGIGLIVKFWPQITEFFRGVLEKFGILIEKNEKGENLYKGRGRGIGDNIRDFVDKKRGIVHKSGVTNLVANPKSEAELAAWNRADDEANLQISESGLIMNMGKMTQGAVSRGLTNYIQKDKEANLKKVLGNYDLLSEKDDKDIISKGSFRTDAIWKDTEGLYGSKGLTYVIAPLGTREKMRKLNKEYKNQGGVGNLLLTSAYGTAGAKNVGAGGKVEYLVTPHKGHKEITDVALDVGGFGSSQEETYRVQNAFKKVYGKNAYYEGDHFHLQDYLTEEGQKIWALYRSMLLGSKEWVKLPESERTQDYMIQAARKNLAIASNETRALEEKMTNSVFDDSSTEEYDKLVEAKKAALKKEKEAKKILKEIEKVSPEEWEKGKKIHGVDFTGSELSSYYLQGLNMLTLINWQQQ